MTRVLIVDDHAANLYLLRVLLEANGFAVDEAGHGAEALVRARQNPPDLVISDLLMPVLDGYALLRQWRADDRLRHIPFIVYTATYTEPRDERLAMVLGADAFLIKPSEPASLVARVREMLAMKDRGVLPSAAEQGLDEHLLLQEYNDVLVRKLEKKAAEAEESEQRLRTTFEQAAVGLAHVGPEGQFLWVNARLCDMTGYSRAELLSLTFTDLTVPEFQGIGEGARVAMLAGKQAVYSDEKRYRRKDGSAFWANIITTLGRNPSGDPGYFISVILDITERKALEEQLRQSQKMEAVGRLAGGVAHDFNNLLTIISGYSDLLLAVPTLGDADRDAVTAIRDAGERAAALTRQLLGFSRQTMLQPSVLDLNALVTDTCKMLHRLIGEDIQITTVLSPRLSLVKVDPSQFGQVLMNLAVNARDAMPQGGKLTIETANVLLSDDYAAANLCRPGLHVMLAMTDTGCGMSPDVVAHIFEPFFTTKAIEKGTGLGLSMVFGIVQQSNGSIHVSSEPGKGTTFKIYLPVVADEARTLRPPLPRADVRGTETILLVEDDAGVRALALRSLQKLGYAIVSANDGRQAIEVAEGHNGKIDLLLTDVVMPHLSGPEMAHALRSRFPHLKVLFMSGYTDDAVVRHGLLDATSSFIQKPYTPLGLAQKVRQVLDQ